MVTGDYHHTALGVAKQTGMVQPETEVIIIDACKPVLTRAEATQAQVAEEPLISQIGLTASPELSREASLPTVSRDLLKPVTTLSTRTSDLSSVRARLVNLERIPGEQAAAGLRFVFGENNQQLDQSQALTSLAEGRAQCAVTGAAFELLLQQQDLSTLEVVMRSVSVFARMQPHQKGQVMDLVTRRGIHQMASSGSRYIPVSDSISIQIACKVRLPTQCMQPTSTNCSCSVVKHKNQCLFQPVCPTHKHTHALQDTLHLLECRGHLHLLPCLI